MTTIFYVCTKVYDWICVNIIEVFYYRNEKEKDVQEIKKKNRKK